MATPITFPQSFLARVRAQRDLSGLEALDTACDIEPANGSAMEVDISDAAVEDRPVLPLVGLRFARPVDRISVYIVRLKPPSGLITPTTIPPQIRFVFKWGVGGADDAVAYTGIAKLPLYSSSGMIATVSGIVFDTFEIWGGLVAVEAPQPTHQAILRATADRNGGTTFNVGNLSALVDGPFK